MDNRCSRLYILSTIACQLSECLDREELEVLSTELTALGEMIETLLTCQKKGRQE